MDEIENVEYNSETDEATITKTTTEVVNVEMLKRQILAVTGNRDRNYESSNLIINDLQAKLDAILPVQEQAISNLNVAIPE